MQPSFTTDWVSKHESFWERLFEPLMGKPGLHFLEVGSWEGRSACWFLEHVLTHPSSRIVCVDTFGGNRSQQAHSAADIPEAERWFEQNIAAIGATHKVEKRKGESRAVLPELPAESFDAIYIDASHEAMDTFEDATAAWRLLKPDGILLFDDYTWNFFGASLRKPGPAINAFLSMYADELTILHQEEQVAVRKNAPLEQPDPLPFITVVVPVFNDQAGAERCVQALGVQTYPKDLYEILIVDNGSEPPLSLTSLPTNARVLHEPIPGPAAARNTALAQAKGELLAFTDADCIPAGDWLEQGARGMTWDSGCGLAGGSIEIFHISYPPSLLQWYDALTRFDQRLFTRLGFAVTANAFMRTDVLRAIGGFDARLLGGAEGLAAYRIRKAGYRVRYVSGSVVRHPSEHLWSRFIRRNRRAAGGQHNLKYFGLPRSFSPTILRDARSIFECASCVRHDPRLKNVREKILFLSFYTVQHLFRIGERIRLKLGGKPMR